MRAIDAARLAENSPFVGVVCAWREFKKHHDITQANVACCRHTKKLFEELDVLEREILDALREPGPP